MALTFLSLVLNTAYRMKLIIVLDVRFLPNPYFTPELKNSNGNDDRVVQYVLRRQEAREFVDRLQGFCLSAALFEREGKSYLTVAIGCTGGKHRSVVVANALKSFFLAGRPSVFHSSPDIDKE